MKSIKVFAGNKRLKDVYPHATRWQVMKYKTARFFKKVLTLAFIVGMVWGAFKLGQFTTQSEVTFAKEIIEVTDNSIPPIMQRIAGCESEGDPKSKGSHVDKNGKMLTHKNNNGTTDIGKYQINTNVWAIKAMEMNLNLTVEKDNEAFAMWLYENMGTEPWYSSKSCWK